VKNKDQMATTMNPGWPCANVDGDRRDVHDHNPATNLGEPHAKGKRTPANDFVEGMPDGKGRIGHVVDVASDVLSSPMLGQRRSATGVYESERNKEKP
jgi:hypothetical protein